MNMKPSFRWFFIAGFFSLLMACSNPASLDWQSLDLTDLEGNPVSMEQYAGKRIFLNFWATWCGPCLAEMPSMEKARQELQEAGYVFVVISDEPAETIRAFRDRRGYGFEYLRLRQSIKTAGSGFISPTHPNNLKGKHFQGHWRRYELGI